MSAIPHEFSGFARLLACYSTFSSWKRGINWPFAPFLLNWAALFHKTVGYKDGGMQTHLQIADPLVRPITNMKALKSAEKFGQTIGIAVGALLSKMLTTHLVPDSAPASLLTLGFLAIVTGSSKVFELSTACLVERSTWLRRLICGSSHIEDNWLDCTHLRDEYGLISIRFVDGSLSVHGDSFRPDGTPVATWDSVMTKFDGTVLEYTYTCSLIGTGHVHTGALGYAKLIFARVSQQRSPTQFRGSFADLAENQRLVHTRGLRLTRSEAQKLLTSAKHCSEFDKRLGNEPVS